VIEIIVNVGMFVLDMLIAVACTGIAIAFCEMVRRLRGAEAS
jgi:hypothetical protein